MKKIYLSMTAMLLASASFAQKGSVLVKEATGVHVKQTITEKPTQYVRADERGSCIYTNDFSVPGDWTIGNNSGNTDDWVIGTGVPSGSFSIAGIASTSAANGFALYDSDLMCSGLQDGYVQHTAPIDLSLEPSVAISFESYYRKYQDQVFVDVSTDGINWTAFEVHSTLVTNDALLTNPEVTSVNVSSIIGGSSTAYFRFRFNGGCDYSWMVDDVCIETAPDDAIALSASSFTETTGGVAYTIVPDEQGPSINNSFMGIITNDGVNTQTNVVLDVVVSSGGSPVATLAGVPSSVTAGQNYSDSTSTEWNMGNVIGTYQAVWNADYDNIALDNDLSDNSDTLNFQVSDHIWGRDILDFNTSSSGLWNGAGNAYTMVNEFDCFVNQNLYGIEFALGSTTVPGTVINPVVYQVDAISGDFLLIYDASSFGAEHTVTAADLSTGSAVWVTSPIHAGAGGSISFAAGEIYLVGLQHYGGSDDVTILNGEITAPEQTVFIFDATQSDWFFLTSTPALRANMNPSLIGINDKIASNLSLGQNTPNPMNDVSSIGYSLNEAAAVSFEVTDITGKVIETHILGTVSAGNHTIELNASNYAKGVYTYSMTAGNEKLTKRMVVTK